MEVEVVGAVERPADADLDHAAAVDQLLLDRPPEGGPVKVLGAEVLVPGVRMGVEVDQAEPPVPPRERPEDRERDGMIASHGQRHHARRDERVDLALDRGEGSLDGDRHDVHVAVVGDAKLLERRHLQDRVPGTDQRGLLADVPRTVASAGAVRRAAVVGNAEQRDVEAGRIPPEGQEHEGRRLAEARRAERVTRSRMLHHSLDDPVRSANSASS